MICDMCGREGAVLRHLTETVGGGDDLLIIENVPVIGCLECGESYLTAETLRRMEHIRRERGRLATRRAVDVVEFA